MVDTARHIKTAKEIMKNRFDIEIEVEFVKNADIEKRVAEVEAQYGGKTHGFGGLFTPEANGHPPLIIVGYDESDPFGYIEIYCHELQHAIDYYEIMQSSDKEILESYRTYFHYYTEYNASYNGILRHTLATLEVMSPQDRAQYIAESKNHAKTVFAKWDKKDIVDVLYYLARFAVFTYIEGRQDDAMLAVVPQVNKFISIANLTNRYQPTPEWYAEFKKMIDGLTVKE